MIQVMEAEHNISELDKPPSCCRADNLKLTFPTAAALFQMAWGIASLPGGGSEVNPSILTEMRWATDYLMACFGNTTLVTQVGYLILFGQDIPFSICTIAYTSECVEAAGVFRPMTSNAVPACALDNETSRWRRKPLRLGLGKVPVVMYLRHHVLCLARPCVSH